jgi:hypothetical protein
LWKDKCESYFDIFGVSEALKPRFAALNFYGPAEAWLQTYELRDRVSSWEMLHAVVCDRFDKDQYQLHMKQLDNLKQTTCVADYHAKFDQLAHNIMLYNPNYDDTFLVVRFLIGLKDEIRAPIALHRPKNVDIASYLALLQKEELESRRMLSYSKVDIKEGKSSSRVFSARDKTKFIFKKDEVKKSDKTSPIDKWAALKEFRRSNNLCFTCGEKWGKGHQCPAQVSINAIHELMEVLDFQSDSDSESGDQCEDQICVVMDTAKNLDTGQMKRRKTMRFPGFIGKQEVLILLDFGSACTFITSDLAQQIQQHQQSYEALHFSAANGSPMVFDSWICQMQWSI